MIMILFNWLLTGLCLLGTWGNAKQKRWGFAIWIFTNTSYGLMDLVLYKNFARFALFFVQTCLCVFGFINWKKIEEGLNANK